MISTSQLIDITEVTLQLTDITHIALHLQIITFQLTDITDITLQLTDIALEFSDITLQLTYITKERYNKFSLKLRIFHLNIVKKYIVIYNHKCIIVNMTCRGAQQDFPVA